MFDSHCHLTFDQFDGRIDQVVADAREAGVHGMITVSTTTANIAANRAIAHAHEHIWYSAGVHPLHADESRDWAALEAVADDPRCVAWGELGLDHHYDTPPRDIQLRVLEEQLTVLETLQQRGVTRPIIVHCRKSFDHLLPVFRATSFDPSRFVFHCFTGSPDDARAVLDFGAWISFTGVVTFKNATEVADACTLVPLDRMMIETDAPFLSPEPVRTVWPNEPKHVPHIGRFIARLRGIDPIELERTLDANTERFFGVTINTAR